MRYTPCTWPCAHTAAALERSRSRLGEPDHRRGPPGARRRPSPASRCAWATNDGPQQEVFGRIARDRELGERHEVAAGGLGPLVGSSMRARCRRGHRPRGSSCAARDTEPGHGLRIRDTAGMTEPGHGCSRQAPWRPRLPRSTARASTRRTAAARAVDAAPSKRTRARRRARRRTRSCATALVALACASRSLSSARSSPTRRCSSPLRDDEAFGRERTLDDVPRLGCARSRHRDDDAGALRRWKRRELLRIAARDLLGVADLPRVGRELAALAEVVPRPRARARRAATSGSRSIGDGQARRTRAQLRERHRRAVRARGRRRRGANVPHRAVLDDDDEPTADGIVFRTDANLRPEGRRGR